ncbi:hypothetical protein ABN034_32895, partial [Actinopolymorpha sp. B11F2]|uniref:hypothetical protein n=1 Tax=Actinopolymorpha sp. B11F2 TaxID=3160862 RepID=UPI0032E4D813
MLDDGESAAVFGVAGQFLYHWGVERAVGDGEVEVAVLVGADKQVQGVWVVASVQDGVGDQFADDKSGIFCQRVEVRLVPDVQKL